VSREEIQKVKTKIDDDLEKEKLPVKNAEKVTESKSSNRYFQRHNESAIEFKGIVDATTEKQRSEKKSRSTFTLEDGTLLKEKPSKELTTTTNIIQPPSKPPAASLPASTLLCRAPLPPEPPDGGSRGVSSPLANSLLRQVPPPKPPDLGDSGNGKGDQKMEDYLREGEKKLGEIRVKWAFDDKVRTKRTFSKLSRSFNLMSQTQAIFCLILEEVAIWAGIKLVGLVKFNDSKGTLKKGGTISKIPKLVCLELMSQVQLPNKEDKIWGTTPVFEYTKQSSTLTFQGRLIGDLMMKYAMSFPEFIYKPLAQVSPWNCVFIDGSIVKLQCVENGKVWNILENSNNIIVCVVGVRSFEKYSDFSGFITSYQFGGTIIERDFVVVFFLDYAMVCMTKVNTVGLEVKCTFDLHERVHKIKSYKEAITIGRKTTLLSRYWKTYYCDLNLVKNTRSALSFVYDRGKLWKILFDVGKHILDIITLSLQICMQWLFFGFMSQTQVYHHHRKCNETIENDMWSLKKLVTLPNAMRAIIEVYWRIIFISHGLFNFVFDRGKFDGCKISTLRTRLFEGVGIDRDLNCELGLDFGPSLRCGKEEGKE
jgi:hypothetical protein